MAMIASAVLVATMILPIAIIVLGFHSEEPQFFWTPTKIGALFVALGVTLSVAYVFSRNITAPINALVALADEIARGRKRDIRPLSSYGSREVATLSQSFLDLATKLVDRSTYVRTFAAHVSHELKSPLTAIQGAAELLRDDLHEQAMTNGQRQHFLDNIIADAERLNTLLLRLRDLAHAEVPDSVDHSTVDDIAAALKKRFPELEIVGTGQTHLRMALPPEAANIVFANLAENSTQHGARRVDLEAFTESGSAVVIARDNGGGISEADRDRVFQPFFSTRRSSGGTGMGLGIVRTILLSHGGEITLLQSQDIGAAFRIVVPLAQSFSAKWKEEALRRDFASPAALLDETDSASLGRSKSDNRSGDGHSLGRRE
ncbi:HAMP domain-containing sensor histidine kinase [Neorhizobium sp. P12A]|uniref:HAMP domain-containing sensor histidine kinase n=1 Tax=Neorhizobium sp. P12A TaxID=2268027 RepID=UPI0032B3097E